MSIADGAVDLVLAAWRPHRIGFREAGLWSVFYILVASAHGGGFIAILVVVTVASLIKTRNDPSAKAHPGSLRGHREPEPESR